MDASILEIATKVSTPLALAGVTLAFLYLLYRLLLRSRLLTVLGATHSFRIINRVVTYLFVLALVAIVLAISAFMVTRLVPPNRLADGLAMVDVRVIEKLPFPILDLKFRNPGLEVAYIKALEFDVIDRDITVFNAQFYAGPTTWQYDILLEPRSNESIFSIPVSQIVPPNGTDRFQVVVGQASNYGDINFVDYKTKVRVLYNDDRVLESNTVSFRVHSPVHLLPLDDPIGMTTLDRLIALGSQNPLRVREAAKILGATNVEQAVPSLRAIFDRDPEEYAQFYRKNVLPLPYYSERGASPKTILAEMYGAVFWALWTISGELPVELIERVSPRYRGVVLEGLNRARRAFD